MSLLVHPMAGPMCDCGGPVLPGHARCGACLEMSSLRDDYRRAKAEVPVTRRQCARFPACTAHVPMNNDLYCERACADIATSERMLDRLEANGVPTKRTRKTEELARG